MGGAAHRPITGKQPGPGWRTAGPDRQPDRRAPESPGGAVDGQESPLHPELHRRLYHGKKNFSYKFYGQVRGDLFYNSRANAEIVDGLFHLYPKDVALDADGKDLNASPNGSFYLLYSRLGIDVQGPKVGSAKTSLKLEADQAMASWSTMAR